MKCEIDLCPDRADPNGGGLCLKHQRFTAPVIARMVAAIETAICSEDGLDGEEGEAILRAVGAWPKRVLG